MELKYLIGIKPVNTDEERDFVFSCIDSKDYIKVIGVSNNYIVDKFFIFFKNDKKLGIFNPNICSKTGVKIAQPILYMVKRMSKLTLICIEALVSTLFLDFGVEKLSVVVYGNNRNMLSFMSKSGLVNEGIYKNGIMIDGIYENIHFYSMLKEEFFYIYNKRNNKI